MRLNLATLLVLTFLSCHGAMAQEAEESETGVDEFEPAVSSEVLAEMVSTDPAEPEPEPAAPSAVMAQDVRRTANASGVMDEIDLAASEITGNQELPKVLYIVPWQKSEAGELVGKPVNTLLDEVLAPIDRSEFLRRVDYYGDLYREEEQ